MFNFNMLLDELLVFLRTAYMIFAVSGVVSLTFFIIKGLGLFNMAKRINMKSAWLSFLPIANTYVLGKISEKYIKRDGTKSAKFGIILPLFYIAELLIGIAFMVFLAISIVSIVSSAELAIENNSRMTMEMFKSFIPVIISYFVLMAVAICYVVFYYISLYRVYSLYDNGNATIYLVLSILFTPLAAIFILIVSSHTPVFENRPQDLFEVEETIEV
jgi:hypothetical protein